jgi:hypothetical protein
MQEGSLIKSGRKRGPDVWQFRWAFNAFSPVHPGSAVRYSVVMVSGDATTTGGRPNVTI